MKMRKSFRATISFIMHKNKSIIEICVFVLFEPLCEVTLCVLRSFV